MHGSPVTVQGSLPCRHSYSWFDPSPELLSNVGLSPAQAASSSTAVNHHVHAIRWAMKAYRMVIWSSGRQLTMTCGSFRLAAAASRASDAMSRKGRYNRRRRRSRMN